MAKSMVEDKQACREVIGSIIQNPSLLKTVKLNQKDFATKFYRLIYAAVNNLYKNGITNIDGVVIDNYLSSYGTQYDLFNKNNGIEFVEKVVELSDQSNFEYYYDRLKKFSLLRMYADNGFSIKDYYDENEVDPKKLEQLAKKVDESSIQDILDDFRMKNLQIASEFGLASDTDICTAGEGLDELRQRFKNESIFGDTYISEYVTTIFRGMRPGKLTIMSAASGSGKSRFMMANACNASITEYYDTDKNQWVKNPNKCEHSLYINTELSLDECESFVLAWVSGKKKKKIEEDDLTQEEEARADRAVEIIKRDGTLHMAYHPEYDMDSLENLVEQHIIKYNIKHFFFDYISLTSNLATAFSAEMKGRFPLREDMALLNVSKKLKEMATKWQISVDTATQTNANLTNGQRDASAVKGSRGIVEKADHCYILTKINKKELEKVKPLCRDGIDNTPTHILHVFKNRGGRWTGIKIFLKVNMGNMRVRDLFCTSYEFEVIKDIQRTIATNEDEIDF